MSSGRHPNAFSKVIAGLVRKPLPAHDVCGLFSINVINKQMNTIEQAEGVPINIDSAQIQKVHCRDTWCAHNVFTSNGVLYALVEAPTRSYSLARTPLRPVESSASTATCPRPFSLLVVLRCPPAPFQDRPASHVV